VFVSHLLLAFALCAVYFDFLQKRTSNCLLQKRNTQLLVLVILLPRFGP
jgi:hypothetical protein